VVDSAYYLIDNKIRWGYKIYVDDVRPSALNECTPEQRTESKADDLNSRSHYTVIITKKALFSYGTETEVVPLCNNWYFTNL